MSRAQSATLTVGMVCLALAAFVIAATNVWQRLAYGMSAIPPLI